MESFQQITMIIPHVPEIQKKKNLTFSHLVMYTYKELLIKIKLLANVYRAALHSRQNKCFGIKEA